MGRGLWILPVLHLLYACQTDPKSQVAAPTVTRATLQPGCMLPDFTSISPLPEGVVPVALRVSVDAQGSPTAASVVTSTGSPAVDQAWVDALLRCRYSPALSNGQPIDSVANTSMAWNHRGRRTGLQRCMLPPYPSAARKSNEQGTVVVRFVIDPVTRIAHTELATSSGYSRLDEITKRYIEACLEHEEVRNDYPPGKPQTIKHEWRLRDP